MLNFMKIAIFKGIVVLVPIVILYFFIREIIEMMVGFATPIADLFPSGTFNHEDETLFIAIILTFGATFVLGVLTMVKPVHRLGRWVEVKTLDAIPMYRMLKNLVSAFLNLEGGNSFKPAFLCASDGSKEPIYVVETRNDGLLVVMVPWTPTAFAGSIKVVKREQVELVSATLDEFSLALSHFGIGISKVIDATASASVMKNG